MRRETTYYCEGPGCEVHQKTASRRYPLPGWLLVVEGGDELDQWDFCSWDCLMKAAAKVPAPESIGVTEEP